MDKSDDAPLSRSEFVKILLSTPSNCELRCQVLNVFPTSVWSMSLRCVVRKMLHGISVWRLAIVFSLNVIGLTLEYFALLSPQPIRSKTETKSIMLICLQAFYRALHRLQVFFSCSDWVCYDRTVYHLAFFIEPSQFSFQLPSTH